MNLEKTFVAEKSGVGIISLAKRFLEGAGYKRVSDKPIVYERGSLLGSWFSFRPSKWFARATVDMRLVGVGRTEVALKLYVNGSGQAVTPEEHVYWKSELDGFERAITTGEAAGPPLAEAAKSVASAGRRTLFYLIAGASILYVITHLLGFAARRLLG